MGISYLDIKDRNPLTAEEKAKRYSKYYYMEMARPDQAQIDKMEAGPINPKDALRIQDRNDLLNPGYFPVEVGYCVMPDGAVYVANLTRMPGVTTEMFDWWFAWHPLEPLRYKIWDPDDHFNIEVSNEDRKRLLNPNIPVGQRNWGCTHQIVEGMGNKAEMPPRVGQKPGARGGLKFISPEDYGFDMSRFKSPNVATAICGPMCHFLRIVNGVTELRSRFWLGYKIENKKPVLAIEGFLSNPEARGYLAKQLALHCIKEFTNLARILPMVYAEESGKIE
jgi:hypothetical protein